MAASPWVYFPKREVPTALFEEYIHAQTVQCRWQRRRSNCDVNQRFHCLLAVWRVTPEGGAVCCVEDDAVGDIPMIQAMMLCQTHRCRRESDRK